MLGDPVSWLPRYRSVETRMTEFVVSVWPRCIDGLPTQPPEDEITVQLVDALWRSPARSMFTIEYQFVPFGCRADGKAYSKGKIDMVVLDAEDRYHYVAYECKRLNVVHDGRRRSLARQYLMDGLRRFITGQYAEGLPGGCMLGYVMDGDLPFARMKVIEALRRRSRQVGFVKVSREAGVSPSVQRFVSEHIRCGGDEIEIRHTMLPFRPAGSSDEADT